MVEIGGGTKPHPRAKIVIDPVHPARCDAQLAQDVPWPVGYESADEVYASHVLEHVPKGEPIISVMNEAWRVLKPGGSFTILLPVIGVTRRSVSRVLDDWRAWADPTHVSSWWLPESFHYFTGQIEADADYGVRPWLPLKEITEGESEILRLTALRERVPSGFGSVWALRDGWEGYVRLEKPS